MRPRVAALGLAFAGAAVALLATGCAGASPARMASVASPSTAATSTQAGSGAGGSVRETSPAASRAGANHVVMSVGNTTAGVRFAACMRTHGVSGFPDPNRQGEIQLGSGVDPRSPDFRTAMSACRSLLPAGFGQPPTAAQLAKVQQQLLAFSHCMRAHGIEDFPDPSGASLPPIQPSGDLDPNDPQFKSAYGACKADVPAGVPSKALGGLAPPSSS